MFRGPAPFPCHGNGFGLNSRDQVHVAMAAFVSENGREKLPVRLSLCTAAIFVASLLCTAYSAADPLPPTVLVLDESIPHTEYFGKLFASLQSTLKAGSNSPITIYSERLESSYFKSPGYDSLQTFIKEKYRSRPIGVIVADGFDALQFAVSLRTELDPAIPIVFSSIDDDSARVLNLQHNT